jgi:prevent-host-death family protein
VQAFRDSNHALKEGLAQYYTARVCRRLLAQAPGCYTAYEKLLPHQPRAYQAQAPWLADFTPEEVRYAMIAVRREARASLAEFERRLAGARREMRGRCRPRRVITLDHHDHVHDSAVMSRVYPIHEAKAKLSEILRQVKRGRGVVISDRGREVARVVPIEPPKALGERLARLEEEGAILPRDGNATLIKPIARRPGALRRFLESRA